MFNNNLLVRIIAGLLAVIVTAFGAWEAYQYSDIQNVEARVDKLESTGAARGAHLEHIRDDMERIRKDVDIWMQVTGLAKYRQPNEPPHEEPTDTEQ